MNSAIEAFEREFAPWALKLPAADVAARRNGQLRANGWSVLYEFGSDAYGDYLDYYAALRGATDARVNDDWHARIYATGQIVAFPAVLEAYLYGRDPSQEELDRARAPVLESLAAPAEAEPEVEESAASLGTADTALWENLREVVEAEVAGVAPAPPANEAPPEAELPRRPSAETPAEIESVLDAAFGEIGKSAKVVPAEQVERPTGEQAPIEREAAAAAQVKAAPPPTAQRKPPEAPEPAPVAPPQPVEQPKAKEPVVARKPEPTEEPVVDEPVHKEPVVEEPVAPRRSVPGYDPFVELRTLEPKSSRRPAPTGDDFRPYWQRYPARAAGVAAAIAAVVLIAILLMNRGGSKSRSVADTGATPSHAAPADPAPTSDTSASSAPGAPDPQTVATPEDPADTASVPAPEPTARPLSSPSSESGESTVARPVGPGSIAPIVRTDGSAASPSTSHRFGHPTGS